MPTIAQKLCRDIVDPTITPSQNTIKKPSTKSVNRLTTQKLLNKTTKSVLNDKNNTLTNIRPFPIHPNGTNIHEKPKDTLTKLEKSPPRKPINTLITGSTKCNNCVTLVRKQEPSCKCARRQYSISAKQIQTSNAGNHLNTDNACTQSTETSSGIQLLKVSNILKSKLRPNVCVATDTRSTTSQSIVRPSVSVKSRPVCDTPKIISKKRECSIKPESSTEKYKKNPKKRECSVKSQSVCTEARIEAEKTENYHRPELNDKSTGCSQEREEREHVFIPKQITGGNRYPGKNEYFYNIDNVTKHIRNDLEKKSFPLRCLSKPWAIGRYHKRGPDF